MIKINKFRVIAILMSWMVIWGNLSWISTRRKLSYRARLFYLNTFPLYSTRKLRTEDKRKKSRARHSIYAKNATDTIATVDNIATPTRHFTPKTSLIPLQQSVYIYLQLVWIPINIFLNDMQYCCIRRQRIYTDKEHA